MRLYLFLLSSLIGLTVQSQQYNFRNYTVEDGLAQSQINAINQDQLGYLWIGTESGLSRFDGINFVNYAIDNGLPDNKIETIYIDDKNIVWVATPEGIARYDNDEFTPYFFDIPQRINEMTTFQGALYLATNEGLIKFENEKFSLQEFEGDAQPYLRSILNYKNEVLYCGGKSGIHLWNNGFTRSKDSTLNELNVSGLGARGDELLISTYGAGLFSYHLKKQTYYNYNLSLSRIRSMYADENVILCSGINGVAEIEKNEVDFFNEKNGLVNESLISSFRDREGNIWLGTDGNGLLKFLGKGLISYSEKDGLSSNLVMNINEDKDGNYLFGTYGEGLTIQDTSGQMSYVNSKNGLANNSVWSSLVDEKNVYWIATSRGINCFKDGKEINQEITSQIGSKIRSIIHFDSTYVFGGPNGLYILKNNALTFLENTTELNINDLCYESGQVFIASRSGLYVVSEAAGFNNPTSIDIGEESINSVECDLNQNLWIGTNNGLYVKLNSGNIVPIILDQEDFKSKTVIGVLSSESGEVWISTMNGVYQITAAANDKYKYSISHYGSAEGLINLESNLNAIFEDSKNFIWVGTSNGLARIDPRLKDELFDFKAPELHLTKLLLFMEEFDYSRFPVELDSIYQLPVNITLPYNQNHLTFEFIGINLKDPKSVMYEYRLVGANYGWSPLNPSRSATYSSIAPGEYDFEVRATNKNFKWSETKSIHIIIKSPFWKSWWFIILISMAVAGIVLLIFQNRIRVIKQKQENERLGFKNRLLFLEQQSLNASMNRHFIFNSLNSIQYFINSSDKRSANKYLSSFAKLIRKNLDSSTANNFIVTLQEEVDRIELYLTLEKMRFQEKFDYELNVSSSIDAEGIEIPSMILQPFVENSIIHGVLPLEVKGHIAINIFEELGEIIFEVIDDGVGIDNTLKNKKAQIEGDHESKGMEITNRRIELLRKLTGENLLIIGPFQVNDKDGNALGTKVIIKMGVIKEEFDD